jgi:type I restriction enzyme S subunit
MSWPVKRLEEIALKIGSGATPLGGSEAYHKEGVSLVRSLNVYDDGFRKKDLAFLDEAQAAGLNNVELKRGDVLLNITGASIARCCVLPDDVLPARVNQHVAIIRPDREKVDPYYLRYQLISPEHKQLLLQLARAGGSTREALTKAQLEQYQVGIPPLPEQQRIVTKLDAAFGALREAEGHVERNRANAWELFESYLNGVLEGKEGWVEKTLAETCTLRSGTTLPPETEKEAGELAYLKVADMSVSGNERLVTTSSRFVDRSSVKQANIFPAGTTIFPKRGGAILTNKKRLASVDMVADLNIMGLTPGMELLPEFLFNYFLRLDLREINNGSSIPQINNYSIEPLLISFPSSLKEQRIIVDRLEEVYQQTKQLEATYEQKLRELEGLKKGLLGAAFRGEL